MKKIILIIFVLISFYSCTENTEEESMIEETWEILDSYVDTLEWTIGDARKIAEKQNNKTMELENEIKEIQR